VVVARRFLVTSQLIARAKLADNAMLEWFYPPVGAYTQPPDEPQDIVQKYANLLVERISQSIS
jgi:hypothetical protein